MDTINIGDKILAARKKLNLSQAQLAQAPLAITNRYYRAIQTIDFDGARMDTLSYAALKGLRADLSSVTVV